MRSHDLPHSVARDAVTMGGGHDHGHIVEFYESDAFLTETVRDFFVPALREGHAAVIVATAEHRRLFRHALLEAGIDVAAAEHADRLILLDARETLDLLMAGSAPDPDRFAHVVGDLLDRAGGDGRAVRVYGEMVALLWAQGNVPAVIALEGMWNDLGAIMPFSLLCAYPMCGFDDAESAAAFARICDLHSAVIPAATTWTSSAGSSPPCSRSSPRCAQTSPGRTPNRSSWRSTPTSTG